MQKIKIAVQKSGRLNDKSIELLKACGLSIDNGKDQLRAQVSNFPAELLYLRNSDIPKYLEDGVADLAILGENIIIEQDADVEIIERLGFSKCKVSIAVPKEFDYQGLASLNGEKIATSYPHTLRTYLDKNGITAEIHKISGSVEIAPNIGLATAICDIVSSGSTLFKNGLEEKEVILKSEAVLVANKKSLIDKKEILDQFFFRMRATLQAREYKYILMNIPNDKIEEAAKILPVMKSPTVLPLMEEGWSSLHTVIKGKDFWDVIEALKAIGAEGILIVPIEKMVA